MRPGGSCFSVRLGVRWHSLGLALLSGPSRVGHTEGLGQEARRGGQGHMCPVTQPNLLEESEVRAQVATEHKVKERRGKKSSWSQPPPRPVAQAFNV